MADKIRIYISHSIRGIKGNDATDEDMAANNQKAIEFAVKLRQLFPDVEFYVPAEHDEFVVTAYQTGYISENYILNTDCLILEKRDVLLVYSHNHYISKGMQIEIDYAQKYRIPIIFAWDLPTAQQGLNQFLENKKR